MDQKAIQAVVQTLTPISGIMLSPIPLAGLIVVLASNGGRLKSLVFSAAYFCSLWLAAFTVAWAAHRWKRLSKTNSAELLNANAFSGKIKTT